MSASQATQALGRSHPNLALGRCPVTGLSRFPWTSLFDKTGLAVLHETCTLGHDLSPSGLAQMRLDLSTISRHLRSLELQGIVRRTADPDDARAQQISITKRGGCPHIG